MIYVTQGHERGVGLEIFLKSFLLLSPSQKEKITLIANANDFNQNILDLGLNIDFFSNLKRLPTKDLSLPSSTTSLQLALEIIKPTDILVTLPTSKDQLILNNVNAAGYTEFFRKFYKNENISMCFKGLNSDTLLITDHIPLNKVASSINENLIMQKSTFAIECFKKYFYSFGEVIFSGINPHCGENGLLGNEDTVIISAIDKLKIKFPHTNFMGPFSGDTLHSHFKQNTKQLLVYMYHDQGLAPFKLQHGLIGLNVTMGLPFLRLSVDHGTAFDLYGKNKANISSMIFLLNKAFEVTNNVFNK